MVLEASERGAVFALRLPLADSPDGDRATTGAAQLVAGISRRCWKRQQYPDGVDTRH